MDRERLIMGVDNDVHSSSFTYEECCIKTFTGRYLNVFEPRLDDICIEDIAHGLSMECRFGRQLPTFYSVAQHSWLVSVLVDPEHKLAALLHDASEAYMGDMGSPIKKRLLDYKAAEKCLMKAIAEKFGFEFPLHKQIKEADQDMLVVEHDCLTTGATLTFPWEVLGMEESEKMFLNYFNLLK